MKLKTGIQKDWLTTLFIFSVVIGVGISYSSVYFFHAMLLVLCLNFAFHFKSFSFKEHTQPTKAHYFFYFTLGWFLLSFLWADDKTAALKFESYLFFGGFISLFVCYYSVSFKKLELILYAAGIMIGVEIVISLLEIFFDFRWPISRYSMHLPYFGRELYLTPDKIDVIAEKNLWSYVFSMPTGFQWNPNNLSAVLVISFPFFLCMKNVWLKAIACLSILLIIVEASSRLSFYALLLILFLYLIFYFGKKNWLNRTIAIIFLFIATDGFYFFPTGQLKISEVAIISNQKIPRPETVLKDNSEGVRKTLALRGLQMLSDSRGLGVGAGNSKSILAKQGGVGKDKIEDLHFFWLELLVDGGIIYFLVFVAWYLYLISKTFRLSFGKHQNKNTSLRYYSSASFLALTGFGVAGIGPSSSIYLLPMYLLFGISIAVINLSYRDEKNIVVS